MYSARPVLMLLVIVSVASCTWSPVFEREAQLVPAIAIDDETSTASAQERSTPREILDAVAEHHGLEPCSSLLYRQRGFGIFCSNIRA